MLFGRDMIGQLLDRGIQELDGQHDQKRNDHRDVPGRLGAMKKPSGTAIARTIASSRTAASVMTPSTNPRSEFLVALKSRFTARRNRLCGHA